MQYYQLLLQLQGDLRVGAPYPNDKLNHNLSTNVPGRTRSHEAHINAERATAHTAVDPTADNGIAKAGQAAIQVTTI